jgi:hypothetical protein
MTFKNKTKQKYTQKTRRYRLKGGDDWYCKCTDTTKSTSTPSPVPSQFASAKKALADAETAKKAQVKPNTPKLAPPPKVTPPPTPKPTYAQAVKNPPPPPPSKSSNPSPCKPFKIQFPKGSKSFQKVEDLIAQGISAKDACEKIKKENQELDKQQQSAPKSQPKSKSNKKKKGGYKSKKRSPTKKKKSKRMPLLVIF